MLKNVELIDSRKSSADGCAEQSKERKKEINCFLTRISGKGSISGIICVFSNGFYLQTVVFIVEMLLWMEVQCLQKYLTSAM